MQKQAQRPEEICSQIPVTVESVTSDRVKTPGILIKLVKLQAWFHRGPL